jgi:1-acyl-sn-glycerol-3-phosphate acyltransferase
LIQTRSDKSRVARIVAANNILNAVFMVVASLTATALLASGLTIPQLFLVTALMNAAVALYIYRLVPEFLLRFLAWILAHTIYRIRSINTDAIPVEGSAVLACNHVSFVDAVVIMGESPRPIRFVMDHRIFKIPLMNWFFKNARAIAIAPAREDPKMLEAANQRIDAALADGDLVCIFPEGKITYDGELSPFKQGVQKIVERVPVPVYPMALRGLWGSFFSRYGGAAFSRPVEARLRRGLRSKLELIVGEPLRPEEVTPDLLMERVAALRGDER